MPSAADNSPQRRRGNVRRFLAYAWPYRWNLALATLVGVLKFNLPVVFPWILKGVVDRLVSPAASSGPGIDALMGAGAVLFIAYAVITYYRTLIADGLAQRIVFDVRQELFEHLERLELGFFHSRQTGAVASRLITDVATAQSFVGLLGTNLLMELSSLVTISCMVFALDSRLALIAFSTLPFYVLVQKWTGGRMRRDALEARRRMEAVEGGLHETISGIADVKSYTLEAEESRRFRDRCLHQLAAASQRIRSLALSLGWTAFLTRIPQVLVIWVGARSVLRGELSVGALMAFYAYLEMIYNPLGRLADLNVQVASSLASIDRLFEFFDARPEAGDAEGAELAVTRGEIRFEGLTFGYREGEPVLVDVDASVEPSRCVALVGPSGAGKSTLVRLLVRFHEPWRGRITIDGQDIGGVALRSLRAGITFVNQDPVLFSGTIEDNIRMGRCDASREDVARAARLANLQAFVDELPQGLETQVGERGVRLSGGQKQRIAIARAFLKDAPILILDESTSNLDLPSEELVHEAMMRLMRGRTTLVIAHRPSTIERADSVLVLDRGRIVQRGTPARLLQEENGLFARLVGGALGSAAGRGG